MKIGNVDNTKKQLLESVRTVLLYAGLDLDDVATQANENMAKVAAVATAQAARATTEGNKAEKALGARVTKAEGVFAKLVKEARKEYSPVIEKANEEVEEANATLAHVVSGLEALDDITE